MLFSYEEHDNQRRRDRQIYYDGQRRHDDQTIFAASLFQLSRFVDFDMGADSRADGAHVSLTVDPPLGLSSLGCSSCLGSNGQSQAKSDAVFQRPHGRL